MSMGMNRADLEHELRAVLSALDAEKGKEVIGAVAAAIDKNNRQLEMEIGKKFADIERAIGRR